MTKIILFSVCFLMIFIPGIALAHPHVFINYRINAVFDKKELTGIKLTWEFDDMTSSMLLEDFDKNKDKKFDASEIKEIKNKSMENMKKFNYFTQLKIDDKTVNIKALEGFSVSLNKHLVTYNFLIKYKIAAKKDFQKVSIFLLDKTNFVAYTPFKNAILYKENPNISYQDMNKPFDDMDDNREILFKFKEK